jgi:hypothetical protein
MSLLSRLAVQAARAYGALSSNPNAVSASYLVVAGGGAGGYDQGGGGGAGGYQTSTFTLSTLNTYSITVGAGATQTGNHATTANGSNSVVSGTGITTITSIGGGGAAGYQTASAAGGSGGGGGGANATGTANAGGAGTSGQGFAGGTAIANSYCAAGGGGASAVGSNSTLIAGGNGGAGTASSISGSSVTYAGGGGGGVYAPAGQTVGTGGAGGGGTGGGTTGTVAGTSGTTNLGGGGGGGSGNGGAGGNGGSGIVIISYTSATPKFVGGTLTISGGNQIHTFTSSGTLSPLTPITASYLVVAGGGGGGSYGAGGGAGGLLTSSTTLYSGATYIVTVGAGGAGGANATGNSGVAGSNSVLSGTGLTTLTSVGGGYGAGSGANGGGSGAAGGNGGSGGGSSISSSNAGGTATSGQGFAGGTGYTNGATYAIGGGGGGASAVGRSVLSSDTTGGFGGAGSASSITGSSVTYAGGGGGGGDSRTSYNGGAAGAGGGGAGGNSSGGAGSAGTTNLGGGGGGGGYAATTSSAGGAGGSGTVIISYAGSQVFNGGLVTSSGGNTIHTFNATGALTPLTNNLNNSLRFRSSASANLTRTPSIAGNKQTWTWSGWVKRGQLSTASELVMFGAAATFSTDPAVWIQFNATNALEVNGYTTSYDFQLITTQVFRDPSAWYHIVWVLDTTNATAANRVKLYVNGNQVTAFSTATYPTQNFNAVINNVNPHYIGSRNAGIRYFDGYMTDINFIDGQALEPYYFGNNDAYGNWKPIKYTGMYGTNGFYLTFADTSALTTSSNAGLGKDTSGNGNYWATNNISITAGTTYDAMLDVPTNTSATVANYATLNPLVRMTTGVGASVSPTISNGNLTAVPSANNNGTLGSFGVSSGQWYWEVNVVTGTTSNNVIVGITYTPSTSLISGGGVGYEAGGNKVVNGTSTAYGSSTTTSDVIGVALDVGASTVTFYKNNTSQGSIAYTGTEIYPSYFGGGGASASHAFNFGQRPFTYTPPTGFVALNTYNLSTPTILQGNKYMDATLYTGATPTNVIVNQGQFKPDLIWNKIRNSTGDNYLVDSVRGVANYLVSNTTAVEASASQFVTSINSNGFTMGTSGYTSSQTVVGWQWQAGQGSSSSNTSGSITSTVSVNTTAGFSVVTYTGNGSSGASYGHGLGVAPAFVITKSRSSSVYDWIVYHKSLGSNACVFLQSTSASQTISGLLTPSSTTNTFTTTNADYNNSGSTYVAYCWAEIAGFSKFGSYTGNGSADGTFIYTGFRPKFVMVKRTDSTGMWSLWDTSRNTYNSTNLLLQANTTDAETSAIFTNPFDLLSNGFKLRDTSLQINASGGTFIYMAFAENPFKNANAR